MKKFITGSCYRGNFIVPLKSMEGFGFYKTPDGTEIHGRFKNGKLDGFATVKLKPSGFILKAKFERGVVVEIDEIIFPDGLSYTGKFDGEKISPDTWTYCSQLDRRFALEVSNNLQTGPEAFLASNRTERAIPTQCYDTGDGIYFPISNTLAIQQWPLNFYRYVCPNERNYIMQNYRVGRNNDALPPPHPDAEIARKIIENNKQTPCWDALKEEKFSRLFAVAAIKEDQSDLSMYSFASSDSTDSSC